MANKHYNTQYNNEHYTMYDAEGLLLLYKWCEHTGVDMIRAANTHTHTHCSTHSPGMTSEAKLCQPSYTHTLTFPTVPSASRGTRDTRKHTGKAARRDGGRGGHENPVSSAYATMTRGSWHPPSTQRHGTVTSTPFTHNITRDTDVCSCSVWWVWYCTCMWWCVGRMTSVKG